jgi:SH3-like domain-containing protein
MRTGRALLAAAAALLLAAAADKNPVPRFASLSKGEVNLRAGPGPTYPIDWVYQRKGLPVEIIGELDVWRQIRDSDGTTGWVNEQMLGHARTVLIRERLRTLHAAPDAASPATARAEPGVIARLLECRERWCRIEAQGIRGWVTRDEIWGVYPDEAVP